MAMVHAAIHDAVNSTHQRYEPYAVSLPSTPGASPEAAAATAAYRILLGLFPGQQTMLDFAYSASLLDIPAVPKTAGIALGEFVAAQILALRNVDGSTNIVVYTPGSDPGDWQPTPPAFAPALLPHWGNVIPFTLNSGSQFRTEGPPTLSSNSYAADFNEVKSLGSLDSTTRTPDQTQIAHFWVEGSAAGWNRIARTVAAAEQNTLWENARLFALINLAMADAYIANFETKYHFNFWRPVTAIRAAHTDGNDATAADPAWETLRPTPPIPDYPSAHAAVGAAAARALALFFGTDDLPFTTTSNTAPGVVRSYEGFSNAAMENALSRIYVGFHFRTACRHGLNQGRQIGQWVFRHFLRPAD
jgi:hypothetical protein